MSLRSQHFPGQTQLLGLLGGSARVLVWAVGPADAVVVATVEELAVRQGGDWQLLRWDRILRGGWRAEDSSLFWETADGPGSCVLEEPGELPIVFKERVQASTVMVVNHDLPQGGGVQITARRSLDVEGQITWLASATGGADLGDPDTAAFVVEQTDHLRSEYGL